MTSEDPTKKALVGDSNITSERAREKRIEQLKLEIEFLEWRLRNCKDESVKRSLEYMIESRKRVLSVLL